jgi:hypothetical protein
MSGPRIATIIIGGIDAVLWIAAVILFLTIRELAETIGLYGTHAFAWSITFLFAVTVAPGIALLSFRRAPITALGLTIAFAGCLVGVGVAGTIIAWLIAL